jgi:hypothetical protein
MCVNGCILYYDPIDEELAGHCHSHRTRCPRCNEPRDLPNGKPRRVVFYFPLRYYFRDLFARPDLVPYLLNDQSSTNYPSGSLRRSRGWQRKVVNNPNIHRDNRNQAIVGSGDGIPLMKDKNARGGWPLGVKSGNLPPTHSDFNGYAHMVAYVPEDHQSWDPVAKKVILVKGYVNKVAVLAR